MKSCPTCNRTFEDTFTFCLVDGSILSAPYDPQATLHNPKPPSASPLPTEVLPSSTNQPPTIVSPSANPHMDQKEGSPSKIKRAIKQTLWSIVAGLIVGSIWGAIIAIQPVGKLSDLIQGALWGIFGGVVGVIVGYIIWAFIKYMKKG